MDPARLTLAWIGTSALAFAGDAVEFSRLGLTIDAPPLEGLAFSDEVEGEIRDSREDRHRFDQRRVGLWTGSLGESQVRLGLHVYEGSPYLNEPGDANDRALAELRARDGFFADLAIRYEKGPFGYAPFVQVVESEVRDTEGSVVGARFSIGGLLELEGYVLHARCEPAPDASGREALREYFARAIRYEGPERDAEWTLDEVRERWVRDTPEDLHEDFLFNLTRPGYVKKAVVRTDHYIILTNSSSGKLFAKKMEENYDDIAKVFPFEEVPGMRRMPVFLFRTRDQYNQFYARIANVSVAKANRTGGHAWRDYYATWYEAPGDPVHIHECTHQIFHNRMGLHGGGSWFQEGVAEYIETRDSDRNIAARQVKNGEHTALPEFVERASLVGSKDSVKGGSGTAAADAYKQAALLIEFLRESKYGKEHFEDFLYTVGRLPRNDKRAIEAAVQRIYGADLAALDAEWRQYCKKR